MRLTEAHAAPIGAIIAEQHPINRMKGKPMKDTITYNDQGQATSFTGEGINVFAMAVIATGLRLYASTGIRPNRAYTPKAMMAAAERYTGMRFKARDYIAAADALTARLQALKASIGAQS